MYRVQSGSLRYHNNGEDKESIELARATAQEVAQHLNGQDPDAWITVGRIVPEGMDVVLHKWVGSPDGWVDQIHQKPVAAVAAAPELPAPASQPSTFKLQSNAAQADVAGTGERPIASVVLDDGAKHRAEMERHTQELLDRQNGAGHLPLATGNGADPDPSGADGVDPDHDNV